MEDKTIKDIVIGCLLAICGCVSLYLNNPELSGVCFGALAGYSLKNGVAYAKQAPRA